MYPRPDSVVGTDRLPQFTVNTILNMKFNRPIGNFLQVTAFPSTSFNGAAGASREVPCSGLNIAPVNGKYTVGGDDYISPPPAQFGSNPNLIKFLANILKANLGQSVSYRVVFYNPNDEPLFIDVTFFGVMLSSPYLINRDYHA
jgi:hypothetical protein